MGFMPARAGNKRIEGEICAGWTAGLIEAVKPPL